MCCSGSDKLSYGSEPVFLHLMAGDITETQPAASNQDYVYAACGS